MAKFALALFATLLVMSSAALAADIQVNGTCVVGTCPPPSGPSDALTFGQSIGPVPGSTVVTFGNGDAYLVTYNYSASYTASGTELVINPTATYTGASPSVGNDTIDFNFFQNYYDNSPGSYDGDYTETVVLGIGGNVGAASSATGQLFYDNQGLPLVTQTGVGNSTTQHTATLTGLTDPTLAAEYEFVFNFASGTMTGGNINAESTIPEPGQAIPLILSLGLMAAAGARKRFKR